MKTKRISFRKLNSVIALILITYTFFLEPTTLSAASMSDYCLVPPYVKTEVKPNIMIIMDNALGMAGRAYTDPYVPTTTYEGYFQSDLMYRYNSPRWEPSSSAPAPPNPYMSGNLLNWATTSRYDLLQKILVGGISTSRQTNVNTLVSKSNAWTATLIYTGRETGQSRTCLFVVDNANVEIKDNAGGSCGYFDSPRDPVNESRDVASIGPDTKFAMMQTSIPHHTPPAVQNDRSQDEQEILNADSLNNNEVEGKIGLLFSLWSNFINFLIPDAEATKPLAISHASPPNGTECTAYAYTIAASGGSGSGYTWSISAGSLPSGLTLTTVGSPGSGVIAGTPTTAGTYTFTVYVRDSVGGAGHEDSAVYSITISAVSITITTSSPLSDAMETAAYSTTISTNNVCTTGGYAWSITSGSLPSGLSLNASTGVISGTPATAGTYNFTVQVVGYGAHIATKIFSLTVLPAPTVLTITTTSPLPDATEDSPYTTTITAMNYVGACTWSVIAGSLPSGLTLDAAGTPSTSLHGTPTTIGTYNFTIQVNSPGALGTPATKAFSLTVNAVPVRTTGNLNVKVCVGDYATNCTTAGTSLKSGIVDEFWSQARYGIQDFNKQAGAGVPNISNCIEQSPGATPDENFLTAIENAVPIDVITPLVDAEWTDVDNFANGTGNCDPFTGAGNCPKNFILMITDGVGANQNNNATKIYTAANGYTVSAGCSDADYVNLTKNSCFGYNTDLRNNPTFGATNITGKQIVSTYIVNTMGAAMTAGYNPETSPTTTGDMLYQAAGKGGGQYYPVTDAAELRETLIEAFKDIIKRAAAGTAASVLASGEGSGANLVQAVFYPRRKFFKSLAGDYDEIAWIGRLTNLWYYVDPFFGNSNIREDGTGDKILNLDTDIGNDYIAQLYFDTTAEQTKARRWADTNGDGVVDGSQLSPDIEFEKMGALWEAGLELWKRDITSDPRGIITWLDKDSDGIVDSGELIDFSAVSYSALSAGDKATMRASLQAADDAEAENIIRYINGEDLSYRTRRVKVDLNNDGDTSDAGEDYKVWKLGDVLNSTPKISSWLPLSSYQKAYNDNTYGEPGKDPSLSDAADNTKYITSDSYRARNIVYAGANDGMLHAFNLGKLELSWIGQSSTQKARLTGSDFGKEVGAFIPKNALPYLKYQMLPGYCHIYSVDLTPYLFDASINKYATCSETNYWDCAKTVDSWRTILIGGMRFGGACRNLGSTCTDCVKTPIDGVGYSSYFALDVTDQNNPQLLWEFSSPELGFATSGPAVIRINARDVNGVSSPNKDKNGRWFVVFGSGPTGPVTTDNTTQFLGRSDQNLKIFILDLKTGALATTNPIDTGIQYAFAGSMLNATHDSDTDYQDDVVYIPYVKRTGTSPNYTWTDGGILRLVTREDLSDANLNNTALYPANWVYSTVMDGIGPVTSSVVRLQNKNTGQLWLYFGTGRYYFEQGSTTDDATGQRQVFGIKEPCFQSGTFLNVCTDTNTGNDLSRPFGDLTNVTDIANIPSDPDAAGFYGWYINLDPAVSTANPNTYTNCNGVGTTTCAAGKYGYCEGTPATVVCRDYKAERVITDPLATTSGLVFFTTYKPYSDECALGGKSFIWATKYDTGGAAGALLKGKALVQVSTGSIEQIDLSTAFSEKGGRRSSAMEGVPPTAQGLSLISSPPPVKRVLHIRER